METNAYMRALIRKRNRERNEAALLLLAVGGGSLLEDSMKDLEEAVRIVGGFHQWDGEPGELLDRAFFWQITLQGGAYWNDIYDWLQEDPPHRDPLQRPHVLAELTNARDILRRELDKKDKGGFLE